MFLTLPRFPVATPRFHGRGVISSAPVIQATGIRIPGNNLANSNAAILFAGSDILPRVGHTAIVRFYPTQQNGYGALMAHSSTGVAWQASTYEFLTCSHPCDGTLEAGATGQRSNAGAGGGSGSIHYWEIAGLGAFDYIANPGGSSVLQVVMGRWYVAVRQCQQIVGGADDGKYEHIFYPDYLNNKSFKLRHLTTAIATPNNAPTFTIGSHDWTQNGNANNESPCGTIRGIQLYNSVLSEADLDVETLNHSVNAAQTSNGQSALFYINQNPTPDDISDKKTGGTARNPVWRNANHGVLENL